MFRLGTIAIILTVATATVPHANAADIAQAQASLVSGKYDEAFQQASLIGDAEALMLGAEALNTKILLGQSEDAKDDSKTAMQIAEDILANDPTNNQAKLLYAISYGFYGRSVSPIKAWRKKMPQKIEAAILEAIETNPDNANSYALYAGWHLGVCAKAGKKTAKRNYGASIADGISHFEKAKALSPDDMMINANYALMLVATDAELHGQKIDELFSEVGKAKPKNSAEIFVQDLVRDVMAKRDSPKKARKAAEKFLGW